MTFEKIFIATFLSLLTVTTSWATNIIYDYDAQDRLSSFNNGSFSSINYGYDAAGNRLSTASIGTEHTPPSVTDVGTYSLKNSQLEFQIALLGEVFGNVTYEFALGTTPCGNDIADWAPLIVQSDGTFQFNGLNLPWGQKYFVCVRVRNFAGDVITGTGSSDGIFILDPSADHEGDGASNIDEANAGTDPFDSDSDDDGMTDGWEITHHMNPLADDTLLDKDGDRFCNLREFFAMTNPDDIDEYPEPITIYVDDDNTTAIESGTAADPFNTISEAVAFAGPRDAIAVAAGNYVENLLIDKHLTLKGEGQSNTIIDGSAESLPAIRCVGMTAGLIEGFQIRRGTGANIQCEQSVLTISRNMISFADSLPNSFGDGIVVAGNSDVTISHNIVYANDLTGISITENAAAEIVNNTIAANDFSGIHCLAGESVTVRNNIIADNIMHGIVCEGDTLPKISYNNVWSHTEADYLGCIPGAGDISGDPLFASFYDADFHLRVCSPSIDAGDPASNVADEPPPNGGRINMGAYGGTTEAAPSISNSADMDDDGDIDASDLFLFTQEFGGTDCGGCPQDLDEDGDVDIGDLEAFTCKFGR